MILRGSPHRGKATLRDVIDWAEGVVTNDSSPYRKEFIELAHTALDLQ
jgi:hypothetical protein